jgi:hypothetical protein
MTGVQGWILFFDDLHCFLILSGIGGCFWCFGVGSALPGTICRREIILYEAESDLLSRVTESSLLARWGPASRTRIARWFALNGRVHQVESAGMKDKVRKRFPG